MAEGDSLRSRLAGADAAGPYALIVESMTEGVSLAAEDGTIVYTNPAEDAMFGYAPGELIGRHVSVQNAYPPEENEARVAEVIATLKRDGRWEGEWHNRRRDGSTFYTASRITAVDVEGRTHWLCVQRDISAERRAEQAHRASEERLQLAVEGTGVGIYDLDLSTGEGVWSETAFRILGLEPAPDGRADFDMWRARLHPEDTERVLAEHEKAAAGGLLRMEFRIVRADNGETRWLSALGRMIKGAEGMRSIGTVLDVTERRDREEHQRLLVNELNHRVKNTLAIVQGIAQQTFKGSDVPPGLRESFAARLGALATAHGLLTRENWESAAIGQIVDDALGPYRGTGRVSTEGPDLRLLPKTAVSLALAVHELGTNAAKYGALSTGEGAVAVRWTADDGRLSFVWRESGGPSVTPPAARGFGTRMIERALAAERGGTARIDFAPEGLVCTVEAALPAAS